MSVYWRLNNKHQNKKMTNDLQMNRDTKFSNSLQHGQSGGPRWIGVVVWMKFNHVVTQHPVNNKLTGLSIWYV